jgi:alpha-amylase/alpha-mannosidase (GH57 family)
MQIPLMTKFICIHGHFYQPPRENPWLESVELQDSAAPWHDWNERVTVECYGPNTAARILNGEGKIENIISNYSKISFNFGPALLAWMKDKMPRTHDAIVAAEKASRQRFSGHGSAIAQVYNHMILPLANPRDKFTQIFWGIRDFEFRFGRKPEGMWLAETAADSETLDALTEQGIQFTVLSPFQARQMRRMGDRRWQDVNGAKIDPSRAYRMKLPSGRSINLFFYDGPLSQAVAFEKLLGSGERFANRIMGAFNDDRDWEQLAHLATDGESYGHHHRHGEMALAYALEHIEKNNLATLTNYGEYLEKHPPQHEVRIHEKSAWSCSHGVGRWMADCGCNSGGHGDWKQHWRAPLREALDWLRDEVGPHFDSKAAEFLRDPWVTRNEYINVILDRSPETRETFLATHAERPLSQEEKITVYKLLELQRHAMLMYTSCGWFFDELSGIETVQVIQYAARVIQLANEIFGKDFEPAFLERLERAKSNIPEHADGRVIYQKFVKPAMIDWPKAAAHYAISSVFQEYGKRIRMFSFTFEDEHREFHVTGKTKLAIGRVRITSEITQERQVLSYGILYMGEHNLIGGVCKFATVDEHDAAAKEILQVYETADYAQVIRLIDQRFGGPSYTLKSLFKDEQRRILNEIVATAREDLEGRFRLITERYAPLMKFLEGAGAPLPAGLQTAWDLTLRGEIRKELINGHTDLQHLKALVQEAQPRASEVLNADISYAAKSRMEKLILQIAQSPEDLNQIKELEEIAALIMPLPIGLNLAEVQNTYWKLKETVLPEWRRRANEGDGRAQESLKELLELGQRLAFAPQSLEPTKN